MDILEHSIFMALYYHLFNLIQVVKNAMDKDRYLVKLVIKCLVRDVIVETDIVSVALGVEHILKNLSLVLNVIRVEL
jgi:hypothetical protein